MILLCKYYVFVGLWIKQMTKNQLKHMTSVTKLSTALAVSLGEAEEVSRRLVLAIEPRKKHVLAI